MPAAWIGLHSLSLRASEAMNPYGGAAQPGSIPGGARLAPPAPAAGPVAEGIDANPQLANGNGDTAAYVKQTTAGNYVGIIMSDAQVGRKTTPPFVMTPHFPDVLHFAVGMLTQSL